MISRVSRMNSALATVSNPLWTLAPCDNIKSPSTRLLLQSTNFFEGGLFGLALVKTPLA